MTIKTIKIDLWLLAASYLALACMSSAHAEQACCGEFSYDTDIEECCNGVVVNKGNCCGGDIKEKVADPCTGELVCPGDETKKIWVAAWLEGTYTITIKQCQERKESYTYTVPPSVTVSWENLGEPSNSSKGEHPEDAPLPQLDSAQWSGSAEVDGSTPKVTVEDYQPLGTTRTIVTKITYKWKKFLIYKACPPK